MSKYIIHGQKNLQGEISVKGAKNASLPILCATLLAKGTYNFSNVPELKDVEVLMNLLHHLGLEITKLGNNKYSIVNNGITTVEAPYELVKPMRASFLVMGPLLGNKKKARVSMPGGCAIGSRPINFHLQAFEKLGATITIDHGFVSAECQELIGNEIIFSGVSVTGTENVIMAAVLATGITTIKNAACEPEIIDLCNLLIKMGAKISGAGSETIIVEGVNELTAVNYEIIPDRIEAGTFIILSALMNGNVIVKNACLEHLNSFVENLEKANIKVEQTEQGVIAHIINKLIPLNTSTSPYPGFATDLQPQLMVLLSQASGESTIEETIFENRFMHVQELNRLGAKISISQKTAHIIGPKKLVGAEVSATDLRAGAALVLAGLIAENTTTINEIEHIERGYEDLVGRLQTLGADIKKE